MQSPGQQFVEPSVYVAETVLLPPDAAKRLLSLSQALERSLSADTRRPLSHREYERRFREWRQKPPANVVMKANVLGVSRGLWAVDPFYREVFAALHPEWTPTGKAGRPEGYSPARRARIAKGEIVSRLLDAAEAALRSELEASTETA